MPMERLAYRNKFVRELVQNLENYSEADCADKTPQVVSGPDNLIILRVSEDEWKRIVSSIFTGADICYPEESDTVRWSLLRAVECPVSICDLIINCIQNNPATLQAIIDGLTGDDGFNQYLQDVAALAVLNAGQRGENLLKPGECREDYIFNQTSRFVFLLNQLAEDLFEAIETGTNSLERGALLLDSIPGLSAVFPVARIAEFADDLASNVQEDYLGAYDQAMYDDLRCGLFCAALPNCEFTIETALSYYISLLQQSIPTNPADTLAAISEYLLTGNIPGDTPVYAVHILIIACLRAGQELFGIDFAQLGIRIVAAGDEPDNDWQTLCEACNNWEHNFPDEDNWADFNLNTFQGSVPSIQDNKIVAGMSNETQVPTQFLDVSTQVDADIRSFAFAIETNSTAQQVQLAILYIDNAQVASIPIAPGIQTYVISWQGISQGLHTYRFLSGVYGEISEGYYLRISASTFTGKGEDPFTP